MRPRVPCQGSDLGPREPITRFRCIMCGHLSAGRIRGRGRGDGSFRYPRRHLVDGSVCAGMLREAEWVEVEIFRLGVRKSHPFERGSCAGEMRQYLISRY